MDELQGQLVEEHNSFHKTQASKSSNIVIQPLHWESSLNHLIDEEDLFVLLENTAEFSEFLRQDGRIFDKLEILKVD